MSSKRFKPAVRKEEIIQAAVALSITNGYMNVTRDDIAEFIGVVGGTIQYHFGTMGKLRSEIMRHAVKTKNATLVAQGLANKSPYALRASDELKALARLSL